MNFKVGDSIGAYRLLSECGEGAYGKVFFAESTVTHRRIALKVVYRHGRNCERELRGLGRYQLICPRTGLLQVYHVEDCGEYFFYTMDAADNLATGGEYVPDTLANRLRASGRLSAEAVRKMAGELIECLNTLHGKGLLHRDVKPDNILWIDGVAKLGDIGLVATDGATVLAGTPGFLPPEVLAGMRDYEPKDDFYALGKAIYCAVTGNPVEKFPSFPGSRTLGACGDLVVLYNRLCRGETVLPELPRGKRRIWAVIVAVAAFTCAVLCVGIFFLLIGSKKSASDGNRDDRLYNKVFKDFKSAIYDGKVIDRAKYDATYKDFGAAMEIANNVERVKAKWLYRNICSKLKERNGFFIDRTEAEMIKTHDVYMKYLRGSVTVIYAFDEYGFKHPRREVVFRGADGKVKKTVEYKNLPHDFDDLFFEKLNSENEREVADEMVAAIVADADSVVKIYEKKQQSASPL